MELRKNCDLMLSICVPTLNRGHMLPGAIQSALADKVDDIEIVVVDNASSDHTAEVLRALHDVRLRSFRNGHCIGMAENHNRCVQHARGEWILFLHSDDQLLPGAARRVMSWLHQATLDRDVSIQISGAISRLLAEGELERTVTRLDGVSAVLRFPGASPSGTLYRREFLALNPFPTAHPAFDLDLLLRALVTGKKVRIFQNALVRYGHGDFQYSHKWVSSGRFFVDVGETMVWALRDQTIRDHVLKDVANWTDDEALKLQIFLNATKAWHVQQAFQRELSKRPSIGRRREYFAAQLIRAIGSPTYMGLATAARAIGRKFRAAR